jgi:hypothetical protein
MELYNHMALTLIYALRYPYARTKGIVPMAIKAGNKMTQLAGSTSGFLQPALGLRIKLKRTINTLFIINDF